MIIVVLDDPDCQVIVRPFLVSLSKVYISPVLYRWKLRFYFLLGCETFRGITLVKENLTPFNPSLNIFQQPRTDIAQMRLNLQPTIHFFTEKKDEQKGLPKSTIYGIIAGAICFLALIIVIAAIVCAKKRRSRSQGRFTSGLSSGGFRGFPYFE